MNMIKEILIKAIAINVLIANKKELRLQEVVFGKM